MEGLIDEEEDLTFETELKLFSFGTIILLEEMVSFLNVGLSKIRTIRESNLKGGTSYQTIVELEPSIIKSEDVCVRLEVSLEDKVYLKTYYHHI
jgi:predicted metalloprotease